MLLGDVEMKFEKKQRMLIFNTIKLGPYIRTMKDIELLTESNSLGKLQQSVLVWDLLAGTNKEEEIQFEKIIKLLTGDEH